MAQKLSNKIMLITYADSLGRNLAELNEVLRDVVKDAVGGIHILPFFPSTADRGFAVVTYDRISPEFGTWEDLDRISARYYLMADYMINHVSAHSPEYLDYLEKGDRSVYRNYFIRMEDFWPGGAPTEEDLAKMYVRKPGGPMCTAHFADGTEKKVWSTFSDEQIDLNLSDPEVQAMVRRNLRNLSGHGAALIRLDAIGYATKKPGTSCFCIEPDLWDLLGECRENLKDTGTDILPEIHETYFTQLKVASRGYRTYDFALPLLVLQALYFGDATYLRNWMKICPRDQFTTLDTHDGIGVMDAYHLMPDAEIQKTLDRVFAVSPVSRKISTKSSQTLFDAYQVNCSYYSALGEDDQKYLCARAIQFFTPGIPMVYYQGMLAGPNDLDFLQKTGQGRDINRHGYTVEEVRQEAERPVVKKLLRLMEFRNSCPAFDGTFQVQDGSPDTLDCCWTNGNVRANLHAELATGKFRIFTMDEDTQKDITL